MAEKIFIGNAEIHPKTEKVEGEYVHIRGEKFFRIVNFDQMPPFFMNIVSDADHWMFLSSNGGITAGRRNPENALFPYVTDDKVHDSAKTTGSMTMFHIQTGSRLF